MKCLLIGVSFAFLTSFAFSDEGLPAPWWQGNGKEYKSGVLQSGNTNVVFIKSKVNQPVSHGSIGQAFKPPFDWLSNRVKATVTVSGNLKSGYLYFRFMGNSPHGRTSGGTKIIRSKQFTKLYQKRERIYEQVKKYPSAYANSEVKEFKEKFEKYKKEASLIKEQKYSIVFDLQFDTSTVDLIFGINGEGIGEFSNLTLEVVSYEEEVTHEVKEHGYGKPQNLGFNQISK